jgi:hypothetical protein
MSIDRSKFNFALDAVSLALMASLAITGFTMSLALPAGPRGGSRGLGPPDFLGMSRHDLADIHFWIAVAFLSVLVVHLIMHWAWVSAMTRKVLRLPAKRTKSAPC